MVGFQEKEKETRGILAYEKGQWIKYRAANSGWSFGIFDTIKEGEIILSSCMQIMPEERGEWPQIIEKEKVVSANALIEYATSSIEEVRHVMENISPLQKEFGQYILLSAGGADYLGKVHKLYLNSDIAEMLPYINYRCGEPYKETERPLRIKLSQAGTPIPRTEKDLEWRICEIKKQMAEANKRKNGDSQPIIITK